MSLRTLGWGLLGVLLLGGSDVASAGTRTLSTGATFYSGTVIVTTYCTVTNNGKKPATLSNPLILSYGVASGPSLNDCSSAPLPPDATCIFYGSAGTAGGGRIDVQGSTKDLRAHCVLLDPVGTAVQILEMR